MLFNSILNFAIEQGVTTFYSPTSSSSWLIRTRIGRRKRTVRAHLRPDGDRASSPPRSGNWWAIDVKANRDRVVHPEKGEEVTTRAHDSASATTSNGDWATSALTPDGCRSPSRALLLRR
jgi:hypothetical protein